MPSATRAGPTNVRVRDGAAVVHSRAESASAQGDSMVSTFAKDDAAMRAVDKQVVTNAQSIAATIEPFCGAAAKEADNRRPNRGERIRADAAFNMALGEQSAAVQSARIMRRLAALGKMTGGIVHDFRNVLSIIESSLRLVERNS